jgi:hypothetical protein
MPFEEEVERIKTYEKRIKSQDDLEENNQSKLLMAISSNSESWHYGKG